MANYINIESLILDALTDAPVGFEINNKRYSIYPPTLGKKLLIDQLKRKLSINPECSKADPLEEALRVCNESKEIVVGGSSSSSQESSKKGFGTEMTHEDAGELRGRFTALQIAGEESKNQLMLLNQVTDALLSVNEAGNATLNNMLYQQVLTNSYLEDITKYTKALQEMKNDLAAVKNNTAGLARR
ncbi:hypothetical protein ACMSEC_16680 [Bacteroides faecis]|uniref:hypothetical protein n=1 Tax=Bacteroides faecis TaxID=674529 RepID=UPI0039C15079